MNKIILYDEVNFKGDFKELVGDVPDLSVMIFANVARSAKVQGNHWVTYKEVNFKGEFFVLGNGDHKSLRQLDRQICSLRLVKENLNNPEIELFEDMNYTGKSVKVQKKVDELRSIGLDKNGSSHKVTGGVWILHQDIAQAGPRLITFQDDEWSNYNIHGWDRKLASLRPLLVSDLEV